MHTLGLSPHALSLCRWVWELLPQIESATSRWAHAYSGPVTAEPEAAQEGLEAASDCRRNKHKCAQDMTPAA